MRQPRAFFTASGARAVSVVLIAVRAKAVALMLGPEGTGLLGLYTAAQEIGAQAADAGLSHSAVRQIARASTHPGRVARLRRALAIAVLVLASAGALAVWAARRPLSHLLTGTEAHAAAFGLLAVGLFLTVVWRWRAALLTGYRMVGALASGSVLGTALATAAGVGAVWQWGADGLIWAAVLTPAAGLCALCVAGRLPQAGPARGPLLVEWTVLVRLGVSLMLIAQMALIAPMVLRVWLTHEAGLVQAGLFHAAWTVTAQIMAVLLMAVSVDFYPRISGVISDRSAARTALDGQLRLHLAAGGPVLLLLAGVAPWVVTLLYASSFAPAAPMLQGLAIGSLARLISAPLETVLTAADRPRSVLTISMVSLAVFLTGGALGTAHLGLPAIGAAFAVAQGLHLVLLVLAARRCTGLAPGRLTLVWLAGLIGVALAASQAPPLPATVAAALLAAGGLGWLGRRRLQTLCVRHIHKRAVTATPNGR